MFRSRFLSVLTAALCFSAAVLPAAAAEVSCDSTYCFSREDFSQEEPLRGICITGLPSPRIGTLLLGTRVLQPGDILTADQAAQITFCPLRTETDRSAQVSYLPIYEHAVAPSAVMTISVLGKEDKAPLAEDLSLETYKNLPAEGRLKVSDPEGGTMTYTVTRQPRRGTLELRPDGSFTYTPKKNKIGVDSFTFTAADPAGKVSREATVTITILKPSDAAQYTDTLGMDCRFAAEWMRHTGIFVGEQPAGNPCFNPDRQVSRGEFTAMLTKALKLKPEKEMVLTGYTDEIPAWLQPYLTAAVRSGLTAGLPDPDTFRPEQPVTGAEAAVMLQNALDLTVSPCGGSENSAVPVWAERSVAALAGCGMEVDADAPLTRGDTAKLLYQAVKLKDVPVFAE